MDIKLRPHHVRDLPKLFRVGGFQMFVSNWVWYGFRAALFRRKYFKKLVNKTLTITVGYSIQDDICEKCVHKKYCHTGKDKYRRKRMALYEYIVGKTYPIKDDEKVGLEYFSKLKYRFERKKR